MIPDRGRWSFAGGKARISSEHGLIPGEEYHEADVKHGETKCWVTTVTGRVRIVVTGLASILVPVLSNVLRRTSRCNI